jgi:hypothetical protein
MAFRRAWGKLGPSVALCVSLLNFRHRFRGRALTTPPPGFQRMVPQSADLSSAPPGSSLQPLARPPVHPPDARVGLTPQRAFQILQARPAEEIQLLLESFEVPYGTALPDGGAEPPGDVDAAPDS